MRCTCNQEVIRELEELASWCEGQAEEYRDGRDYGAAAYARAARHVSEAITRRRASMQPVRYQETER
jgi:hypothetical protein